MRQEASGDTNWVYRALLEASLSLNVAWIIVWIIRADGALAAWPSYSSWIDRLYLHVEVQEGMIALEQVLSSAILAILLFVVFRMMSKFSLVERLFRIYAGPSSLIAFPVVALVRPRAFSLPHEVLFGAYWQWSYRVEVYWRWLLLEVLLVLLCTGIYFLAEFGIRRSIVSSLLLLHFGLWSWATGMHANLLYLLRIYGSPKPAFWISALFYWGFPVFGFLASVAWALYVKMPTATVAVGRSTVSAV
jgi:hypothetical protein